MKKTIVRGYRRKGGVKVQTYTRKTYDPKLRNSTPFKYKHNNKSYLIKKSNKKQLVAITSSGEKVHFGDKNMPEFPGTKREDNFCARTYGQKANGTLTRNNSKRPNFWNRRITWKCQGKKGVSEK